MAKQARVKRGHARPSGIKQGETRQTGANWAKRSQPGQNGDDFLHAEIFLGDENVMFCKPGTQVELWEFCLILDFDRTPLKTLHLFLYLSEDF